MPSEKSMEKAREMVVRGGRVKPTIYQGGITESCILTIALALDEAKAERTEECALIAEKLPYRLDRKPSWLDGDTCKEIAAAIRSKALLEKEAAPASDSAE